MEASDDEPRKVEAPDEVKIEESADIKAEEPEAAKLETSEKAREGTGTPDNQCEVQAKEPEVAKEEVPEEVKVETGSSDPQLEVEAKEPEAAKVETPEEVKEESGSSDPQRDEAPIVSPIGKGSSEKDLSKDEASLNSPSSIKAEVARPRGFDSRGRKILNHPDPKKNPEVLAREQELRKRMATYRAIAERKEAAALEARKLAADEASRVRNPMQPDLSPRASSGGLSEDSSSRTSTSQSSVLDYPGPGGTLSPSSPRAKSPRSPQGFSIPAESTQGLAPGVARRIGELEKLKLEAVKAEDYAQAFRLKKKITVNMREAKRHIPHLMLF
jgi:hypothetical protein